MKLAQRLDRSPGRARDRGKAWEAAYVGLGAATTFGLILLDNYQGTGQLEFLIVLLGPLLTGMVMRLRGLPWKLGAASWALTGLFMLVFDWIVNNEDQAFHGVLTLVMVALVALGAGAGRDHVCRAATRSLEVVTAVDSHRCHL